MSTIADIVNEHDTLSFVVWPCPDRPIFPADSTDAIAFLTPVIGPSAMITLHTIARRFNELHATAIFYPVDQLSMACGGGRSHNLVARSLARLERFGYVGRHGDHSVKVRTQIPRLTRRHIDQLPADVLLHAVTKLASTGAAAVPPSTN